MKYTYEQVRRKSINLGKSFRKLFKLHKGEVVAVHLPNGPHFYIATLGVLSGGLVHTTLNPLYTAGKLFCKFNNIFFIRFYLQRKYLGNY